MKCSMWHFEMDIPPHSAEFHGDWQLVYLNSSFLLPVAEHSVVQTLYGSSVVAAPTPVRVLTLQRPRSGTTSTGRGVPMVAPGFFFFFLIILSLPKDSVLFFILLDREEGRETLIGCLPYMSQPVIEPAAWACALTGNQTSNLSVTHTTPTNWAAVPHWPGQI